MGRFKSPVQAQRLDVAAAVKRPFEREKIWALDAVLPDGRIANW